MDKTRESERQLSKVRIMKSSEGEFRVKQGKEGERFLKQWIRQKFRAGHCVMVQKKQELQAAKLIIPVSGFGTAKGTI